MNGFIERYKKIRKKGFLEQKYKGKYAFVGVGNHSVNNLYPILNYLRVNLKYIVVKSQDTLELLEGRFSQSTATTNLNDALSDNEIKGVFVSANPTAHFNIAKEVMKSNKSLFIEKPPCASLDELQELITIEQTSSSIVLTGLQRRYSPVYNILSNKVKDASYYTLKYKTGAYPEGDELLDLFIHPLDALFYLFGDGTIVSTKVIKGNGVITYLSQIVHKNGVIGSIEFSTDYSWSEAQDILTISTPQGEYITENTSKLSFVTKPKVALKIPLEKIKGFHSQTTILYAQNSFLPVKEHNQLFAAGYYNELETFVKICENKGNTNNSSLKELLPTYKAIEQLRKAKG
ncbi:MAG: Gfo/Idh/MocA family oxidoreductase [Vicingus serpentipes]|nr:Gfo/Idh/MocA family oxidoreductase [Vicingus serpentipes]